VANDFEATENVKMDCHKQLEARLACETSMHVLHYAVSILRTFAILIGACSLSE